MRKLSLVDETFDLNFISEYHLSIQLSLDGLSFSILDGIQKKYVCLVHHTILSNSTSLSVKKLKELIESEEYLQPEYKSTRITYASNKATVIPSCFNRKPGNKQLSELSLGELKNETLKEENLAPFSYFLSFSMPQSLIAFIEGKFQDTPVLHEVRPFIWNIIRQGNQLNQMAILVRDKYCWIVYLKNNQLEFINSFPTHTDDDALYFTLNVCSQLGIDPETTPLLVDGITSKRAANYHRFRQYVKNVKLAEPTNELQYSYHFNELPDNRFNTLLNSYTCEL